MNVYYNIINVNLTTITADEPISDVPCGDCTLCCQKLAPYLTPDEISSGLYPLGLVQPSEQELINNPDIGPTAILFRSPTGGCSMLINNKCSIYETRPLACRQFDCRKNHHPSIPNMIDI